MIRIGDASVTQIEEITLREVPALFPEWRRHMLDEHRTWILPNFYDAAGDAFLVSVHSWLVRTLQHNILIDTCGGNAKDRPASPRFHHLQTAYLAHLESAGVTPEQIDFVICTHLHVDHVGWNTQLVEGHWVPTFLNAKYVMPRIDFESNDPRRTTSERLPAHQVFLDSILPVIEAGQAMLVEGDEEIAEGVELMPARGHTPGHMAVRVRSRGNEALFIGDVMHHPLQIYNPAWNSKYCADPEMARRTRKELLEHCATQNSLLFPVHFAFPHCGRVARSGNRFSFLPLTPSS